MRFAAFLFSALLLPATSFAGLSSIWRHSAKIKRDGFLTDSFAVQGIDTSMAVRQVPGDGNCLFHAISACLDHACNGTHPSLDLNELMPKSASLRKVAVDYLVDNLQKSLYLEKEETVPVYELLSVVAAQYNMTAEHYCEVMRQSSVWGGGPEIVALSNALCRPIHVYELASNGVNFCFRRMACFGSPMFDEKQAIHILSADSRFPNLKPGRQLANGNHFLALFPCPMGAADGSPSSFDVDGSMRHNNMRGSSVGYPEASGVVAEGGQRPGKIRRFLSSVLTCSCLRRKRDDNGDALLSSDACVEKIAGNTESSMDLPRSSDTSAMMIDGVNEDGDCMGSSSRISGSGLPWAGEGNGRVEQGLGGISGVEAGGLQGLGGGETLSGSRGGATGQSAFAGSRWVERNGERAQEAVVTPKSGGGVGRGHRGIGWTRFR